MVSSIVSSLLSVPLLSSIRKNSLGPKEPKTEKTKEKYHKKSNKRGKLSHGLVKM